MGIGSSSQNPLAGHSHLLDDFVGKKIWRYTDPFWLELLSFPVPLTKVSPTQLESIALPYCEKLVQHNSTTFNFQTLLAHLLDIFEDKKRLYTQQAVDLVVFVRIFVKFLTETMNADDMVSFLEAPIRQAKAGFSNEENGAVQSWVERICGFVLDILIATESSDAELLHLEAMHLLLVLISTQLYSPSTSAEPGGHPFTEVFMDLPEAAAQLVRILLAHFVAHRPLPPRAPVFVPSEPQGVLRRVRSAAASVLWLPIQAITFLVRTGNKALPESPLSETGLICLLVLVHHAPADGLPNPFQHALQVLKVLADHNLIYIQDVSSCARFMLSKDSSSGVDEEDLEAPSSSGSSDAISYRELYTALGKNLTNERSVLLLYDLLHTCPHFRNFAVVQSDLDTLVLPLLQLLYSAASRSASQMYMLLIVLLILSQDPVFSQNIHRVSLQNVTWYTERVLKDTSLGSLVVVLLLRTAHYNLAKLKDVYLHTNTLAALANLAPHAAALSSHASARLVSLLGVLHRRYLQLLQRADDGDESQGRQQELQVYADFLRIVLEILNSIMLHGLQRNPELVYALLHRQDIFLGSQWGEQFHELLENLQLVIRDFNAKIEEAKESEKKFEWSVPRVLQVIQADLKNWPREYTLKTFPENRFTYEEEISPEGFFVPYVWTLAVTHTAIPWRSQAIALFSPVATESEDASLDAVRSDQEISNANHSLVNAADNV